MTMMAVRPTSNEEGEPNKPKAMIDYFPEGQQTALLQLFHTAWKLAEMYPKREKLRNLRVLFETGRVGEVIAILEKDHDEFAISKRDSGRQRQYKRQRQLKLEGFPLTKMDLILSLRRIPQRCCDKIHDAAHH